MVNSKKSVDDGEDVVVDIRSKQKDDDSAENSKDEKSTSEKKENKKKEEKKDERRKNERRATERRTKPRRKKDVDNNRENVMKLLLEEKDDEIVKLNNEIDASKDQTLRRQAEFENFKKRSLKQQEDFKKFVLKDFALDIILINDDVLRAIEASDKIENSIEEEHKSFVEGVGMISKRIEDTLNKYGIFEIDSIDKEFDPNFHEAIEINSSGDVEFDTVSHVYQKGFKIEDHVVRSAKVRVTKAVKAE